jgi:hypothetical protein
MGRPGRLSGGGAHADLGCAHRSRRRPTRRRPDVGIATATARRGTRARLGRTGPAATGGRARAGLGCTCTAGAPRRRSCAQLGRTGTTSSPGGRPSGRVAAARLRTRVGRIAGTCRTASGRYAATRLESTRGTLLGPAQACQPAPGRPGVRRLGRAAGAGSGADRRAGVERACRTRLGRASAWAARMGTSEDPGACRPGGTVVVRSISRRAAAAMDPPGGRPNRSLVIAGRGTFRAGGAARARVHR